MKHVVSAKSYGHGIGAGDVNGDGRNDILTPEGWFEAPADPRQATGNSIRRLRAAEPLGFMYVTDVNGDGRNDVVTSHAHDYGIFWFEQGADGKWTKHVIDDSWSQAHALTLVDLNGDGSWTFSPASASWRTTAAIPASANRSASTGTSITGATEESNG